MCFTTFVEHVAKLGLTGESFDTIKCFVDGTTNRVSHYNVFTASIGKKEAGIRMENP